MPETDATSNDFASTSLARAAEVPVPEADAIAGRFPLTANPSPVAEDERAVVLANLHFGDYFTDHMAHARWTEAEGWGDYGVVPYGNLSLSPATAVLHYGQEIFEGIKAYRHDDGSVWTFRPRYNAARFNASARRLALPGLVEEDFVASLVDLVRADVAWVPSGQGESLYLRPFAFASEAFLGVRPSKIVDYYVIASPSGSYFSNGLEPISIWVSTEYHRAGRGGTGAAKTGGNYASSLLPQREAYVQGCDQVCFLDDVLQENLEELGGMNIMVVDADGTVRTPRLTWLNCSQASSRAAFPRSSPVVPPLSLSLWIVSKGRGSMSVSRAVKSLGTSMTDSLPFRRAAPRTHTDGCTSLCRLVPKANGCTFFRLRW